MEAEQLIQCKQNDLCSQRGVLVQRYVLTERGKLLVATLIVLLLILPPVIIISIRTASGEEKPDGSLPKTTPDLVQYIPPIENDNPSAIGPSINENATIDIDSGNMTFMFTPESQITLDGNVISMIGQLLTSSKNNNDSKMAIEIPQLPDDETAILTTAIINALSTYDIPLSDIIFFVYQPDSGIKTFKINISFQPA